MFLAFVNGCGKEKKEAVKGDDAAQTQQPAEPLLIPAVEKIVGGEDLKGEQAAVREVIINYNRALIMSQINMASIGDMIGLTSKKEYTRMLASIEYDRSEGKIMSCTLRSLAFDKITIKGRGGTVRTKEEWLFEDRDVKTGGVVEPLKNFLYVVEYGVFKEEGKWVVNEVKVKEASEYLPPKGEAKRVTTTDTAVR